MRTSLIILTIGIVGLIAISGYLGYTNGFYPGDGNTLYDVIAEDLGFCIITGYCVWWSLFIIALLLLLLILTMFDYFSTKLN